MGAESPFPSALVKITELDPRNPYPEVLLSSFTGGAHCCNEISILTSNKRGDRWQKVSFGPFNGITQGAEDIDKDGRDEFVTVDNRFLYQFASYASSAAPAQIWQLNGNQFVNVSYEPKFKFVHHQSFPQALRAFLVKTGYLSSQGEK